MSLLQIQTAESTWLEIRKHLRKSLTSSVENLWIDPIQPIEIINQTTLLVSCPLEMRTWIETRLLHVLSTHIKTLLGPEAKIEFVDQIQGDRSHAQQQKKYQQQKHEWSTSFKKNPRFTFESFVVGQSNQLAHNAALTVAENPGESYNPLFIHGRPGVGKTHLLYAIGAYVNRWKPELSVHYTTIEEFVSTFIRSLKTKNADTFKQSLRQVDLLLVDDVQFLERKAKTEEELFHILNALQIAGSQIVLTSDRTPEALSELEERLRERFAGGLVAEIDPADPAMKTAILKRKAKRDKIPITDERTLEEIIIRSGESTRALESSFIKVVAVHSLTGKPMDRELVQSVLGGEVKKNSHQEHTFSSVASIQNVTAQVFKINLEDLVSQRRSRQIVWARQVAMYVARQYGNATLSQIGDHFGSRSHSTVVNSCKRVERLLKSNSQCSHEVNCVIQALQKQNFE